MQLEALAGPWALERPQEKKATKRLFVEAENVKWTVAAEHVLLFFELLVIWFSCVLLVHVWNTRPVFRTSLRCCSRTRSWAPCSACRVMSCYCAGWTSTSATFGGTLMQERPMWMLAGCFLGHNKGGEREVKIKRQLFFGRSLNRGGNNLVLGWATKIGHFKICTRTPESGGVGSESLAGTFD